MKLSNYSNRETNIQLCFFSGTYKIVTVAFSPKVTQDFGIDSSLHQERTMLINLAIDFLQNSLKCSISRAFKILQKPQLYKGTRVKAIETVTKRTREQDQEVHDQIGDLEKMFGKLPDSDKSSILGELGQITSKNGAEPEFVLDDPVETVNDSVEDTTSPFNTKEPVDRSDIGSSNSGTTPNLNLFNTKAKAPSLENNIRLPGQQHSPSSAGRKSLIEEVDAENGRSLITPEHTVSHKRDESGVEIIVVKIKLPGVTSVADCQLDISKVCWIINGTGLDPACMAL